MVRVRPIAMALGAVLATLAPALAAPWGTYTYEFDVDEQLFGGVQRTEDEAYELTYDCTDVVADSSIGILTPEAWDETASYATEVTTEFVIGGVTHSELLFSIENWQDKVAIVAYDLDQPDAFNVLLKVLTAATGTIDVRWLDKSASFDAWGVAGAVAYARINCDL